MSTSSMAIPFPSSIMETVISQLAGTFSGDVCPRTFDALFVGHRSSDRTGIPSQKLVLNIQRTTSRTASTVGSVSHSVTVAFTPSGLRGQSLFYRGFFFENQGRRFRIYHRGCTYVQGEMDVAAQRGNHAGLPQHPFANPPQWRKRKSE